MEQDKNQDYPIEFTPPEPVAEPQSAKLSRQAKDMTIFNWMYFVMVGSSAVLLLIDFLLSNKPGYESEFNWYALIPLVPALLTSPYWLLRNVFVLFRIHRAGQLKSESRYINSLAAPVTILVASLVLDLMVQLTNRGG